MLRMGVPRSAICLKMLADGVSERDVRIFETEGLEDLSEEGMAARRAASRDGVTTLFLKLPGRAATTPRSRTSAGARAMRAVHWSRSPTRSCSPSRSSRARARRPRRRAAAANRTTSSPSWRRPRGRKRAFRVPGRARVFPPRARSF